MPFSDLVTAEEAAKLLDLKLSTVRVMISRGQLETEETRLGRFVKIESVNKYLKERKGHIGRPRKQNS